MNTISRFEIIMTWLAGKESIMQPRRRRRWKTAAQLSWPDNCKRSEPSRQRRGQIALSGKCCADRGCPSKNTVRLYCIDCTVLDLSGASQEVTKWNRNHKWTSAGSTLWHQRSIYLFFYRPLAALDIRCPLLIAALSLALLLSPGQTQPSNKLCTPFVEVRVRVRIGLG